MGGLGTEENSVVQEKMGIMKCLEGKTTLKSLLNKKNVIAHVYKIHLKGKEKIKFRQYNTNT